MQHVDDSMIKLHALSGADVARDTIVEEIGILATIIQYFELGNWKLVHCAWLRVTVVM